MEILVNDHLNSGKNNFKLITTRPSAAGDAFLRCCNEKCYSAFKLETLKLQSAGFLQRNLYRNPVEKVFKGYSVDYFLSSCRKTPASPGPPGWFELFMIPAN